MISPHDVKVMAQAVIDTANEGFQNQHHCLFCQVRGYPVHDGWFVDHSATCPVLSARKALDWVNQIENP